MLCLCVVNSIYNTGIYIYIYIYIPSRSLPSFSLRKMTGEIYPKIEGPFVVEKCCRDRLIFWSQILGCPIERLT